MLDDFLDLLACPQCGGALAAEPDALVCRSCGASYPSRGDVPVLLAGKRPSGEGPGDSEPMLRRRARYDRHRGSRFGSARRYLDLVQPLLRPGAAVLDVGTGPGSYLRWLAEGAPPRVRLVGLDLAPSLAVVAGAVVAGLPNVLLVRASSRRRLPFHDQAFDVVLRRLAPALPAELARVLKPSGTLVQFTFGPDHWREVYDALPELPRPSAEGLRRQEALLAERFDLEPRVYRGYEEVPLEDVLAALEAGPAAGFLDRKRDRPRLEALATGGRRLLILTVEEWAFLGRRR